MWRRCLRIAVLLLLPHVRVDLEFEVGKGVKYFFSWVLLFFPKQYLRIVVILMLPHVAVDLDNEVGKDVKYLSVCSQFSFQINTFFQTVCFYMFCVFSVKQRANLLVCLRTSLMMTRKLRRGSLLTSFLAAFNEAGQTYC